MAKNRTVYGFFTIVTFIFLALYENQMTYTVFYTVILLPLLSLIYMFITRYQLIKHPFTILESLSKETVQKNERSTYNCTINNNCNALFTIVRAVFYDISSPISFDIKENCFSLALMGRPSGDSPIKGVNGTFTLTPYNSSSLSIEMYSMYRGVNLVGINELRIYDVLGLFYFKQKPIKKVTLTILPQVIDASAYMPLSAINSIYNQKSGRYEEDYNEVDDYKKYLPSDGIKRVNWKITSVKNELISKVYKTASESMFYVIFDNSIVLSDENDTLNIMRLEDEMIEILVSVMSFLIEKQFLVLLGYIGKSGTPIHITSSNFALLYNEAAGIRFNNSIQLEPLIDNSINNLNNSINGSIIITQKITEELINMLQMKRINLTQTTIIYVEETSFIKDKGDGSLNAYSFIKK